MYFALLVWLCTLWTVVVTMSTNPVVMAGTAWLASPVLLFVLRVFLEDGQPEGLFDPGRASWTFLFGDLIGLPLAMGAAAVGQRQLGDSGWFRSPLWLLCCIVLGILAGAAFHFLMDQPAYVEAGWGQALYSPSKVAHDFVSYPLLFGAITWLGVPVLVHEFMWSGAVALIGVLVWVAMAAKDATNPPRPQDLHPKWSADKFRVGS